MDLEKFMEEVKTLKNEREILATKVVELEKESKKAVKERDTLAEQLVQVSDGYTSLENKLNMITNIIAGDKK